VLNRWLLLVLALLPSGFLLYYYLRQVRRAPEPWPRVAATCAAGALAFAVVLVPQGWITGALHNLPILEPFLAFGLTEELVKLAAVLVAAVHPRKWDRMSSGLVYGISAGLGFAAVENVGYVLSSADGALGTAALRAVTAVPGHALHSALVGVQLGKVHRLSTRKEGYQAVGVGLLLAILAHGFYDLLLEGEGHARLGVVLLLAVEAWGVSVLFRRAREEDLGQAVQLLRSVPVLQEAPVSALRLLAERGTRRYVPRGRVVVRSGRPGDALFLVLRGTVLLVRDSMRGTGILTRLQPGEFFGEMALVTGRAYQATVTSETDTLILRVPSIALFEVVAQVDGLASALVRTAERRDSEDEDLPNTVEFETIAENAMGTHHRLEGKGGLPERLARLELLESLPANQINALAGACLELRRGPSNMLVRQGGTADGMWIIVSGEVEILRDGEEVARLVEGEFFGEVGLLTGWPATASVRSATPMEAVVLRWNDLAEVFGVYPDVGWQMLVAVVQRMNELRQEGAGGSGAPTEERAYQRIGEGLVARLGLGRPPPRGKRAQRLVAAFPELAAMPASAAEALAQNSSPKPIPDAAIWLSRKGEIQGLKQLIATASQTLLPAEELGAGGRGWFMSQKGLRQAVAASPEVLRLISRHAVRAGDE